MAKALAADIEHRTAEGSQVEAYDPSSQRRTPRRAFRRPVGVLVQGHYDVLPARQLSEGGALIRLSSKTTALVHLAVGKKVEVQRNPLSLEALPIGQALLLTITLPSGAALMVRAKVIYHDLEGSAGTSTGPSIGVRFDADSIALNQRRQIRNYVSAKNAEEDL